MAYAEEHRFAAEDSVYLQIENLQRMLEETNDLLQSSHRDRARGQLPRDELTDQLKDIENSVRDTGHKEKHKRRSGSKLRDKTSKAENLRSFVEWRAQLRVLYDALEDAIEELSRFNTRKARRAVAELRELKNDAAASLVETDEWTEDDIEKIVQEKSCKDMPSTKSNLRSILDDAESVRRLSHKLSAQMKSEVQSLRNECVAMVKDMIAINRVLEEKKRALVE